MEIYAKCGYYLRASTIEDKLSLGAATIQGRPLIKGGYKLRLYGISKFGYLKIHLYRNTDFTYLLTFSSSMKIHTRKSSSGVCIFLYHPHMYQFLRQMTDTIMLIDK